MVMTNSSIQSQFGNQTMTNRKLLPLSTYEALDNSFHEEAIDFSTRFAAGSAWHRRTGDMFPRLRNEYDLRMIEPTPIGPKVDIVESFGIGQDPAIQNLCMTLKHAADILTDTCGSKRPRDTLCHEYPVSEKKPKMICSTDTPFPYESSRQMGLKAPPSFQNTLLQSSSDIPTRPFPSTLIRNEFSWDRMTPFHEFRPYQVDHWETQYEAMIRFRNKHNHCFVPHQYPDNLALSSWVKRQRYQYKVMKAGRHHTMTPERLSKLEAIGFVWDSHKAIWEERYRALCRFQEAHGHTNVPIKFSDKSLAIWVKCQRRQHRLFRQGKPSSMTLERIVQLEQIGFDWKPPIGCPCKPKSNM